MSWYAAGGFAVVILGAIGLEALGLLALWRWKRRGLPPAEVLPYLGAGASLIAASGVAVSGGAWAWVGLLLAVGGGLHVIDLRARWRRPL